MRNINKGGHTMVFKKTITVSKERASELQKLIDMEEINFEEMDIEEDAVLASFTAKFENGFWIDINVCSGQHCCWVDTILYNPEGHEVMIDEPSDILLGESYFNYGGNEYHVNLVEE